VTSGVLRLICVECIPLPGNLWAVGHGVDLLGPSYEADPSPSWRYSPSGSGRASLMSLWARQVRGVLPVQIRPVVAPTSSGMPGLDGRIDAGERGQRHRTPGAYRCRGCRPNLDGDGVQRAQAVIVAPAAQLDSEVKKLSISLSDRLVSSVLL
jgi:hypothetical protein